MGEDKNAASEKKEKESPNSAQLIKCSETFAFFAVAIFSASEKWYIGILASHEFDEIKAPMAICESDRRRNARVFFLDWKAHNGEISTIGLDWKTQSFVHLCMRRCCVIHRRINQITVEYKGSKGRSVGSDLPSPRSKWDTQIRNSSAATVSDVDDKLTYPLNYFRSTE